MADLLGKDVPPSVNKALSELQRDAESRGLYFTSEPLLAQIPDRGHVLALVSGTYYVYFRIGSVRLKVALTVV